MAILEIDSMINETRLLKNACRIHTHFACARYIISVYRLDGAEKATRHIELCEFYATMADRPKTDLWTLIHADTKVLTDNLDTHCGFSYDGNLPGESDKWVKKFFNKFHAIAMKTITREIYTDA